MSRAATVVMLTVVAAASGCTDTPPSEPSWQADVMPILAKNCVRCHGSVVSGGAPPTLRLDSVDPVNLPDGSAIAGAASAATQIFKRVTGKGLLRNDLTMPPGTNLSNYELEVLRNWAALSDGAGIAPRGEGRAGNHPPTISLSPGRPVATGIEFDVTVTDPDGDLVVGSLVAPTPRGAALIPGPVANVVAGSATVTWDTTGLPAGDYPMLAWLDDGSATDTGNHIEINLGMVTVRR
jgi:hypothetical protein